jgi:hypothetical protein
MSTAYESELETALEEEFRELNEDELEDDEGEGFLGALSGLGSFASGLGKLGSVASSIGKLGSSMGKLGGLAGSVGKLGAAAGGLRKLGGLGRLGGIGRLGRTAAGFGKLGGAAGGLRKLGGLGRLGGVGRLGRPAAGFGKLGGLAGRYGRRAGAAARWGRSARSGGRVGVGRSSSLTRTLNKTGIFGRPEAWDKWGDVAERSQGILEKLDTLGDLAHDVDKLGRLAKPGGLRKLGALAGNFGRSRTLGHFVTNSAPLLRVTSKKAAPMVARAIGGPFRAMTARMLRRRLREAEGELYELESEFELETELHEGWHEAELEILSHKSAYHEALAEMMAEAAEQEQNEAEAEAMAGAAAVTVISTADRLALRRVLPHLVRGTAILTRILRANPRTRPAVRAVPTIARRTVRALKQQAEEGTPITRSAVGRAAAREVRRILGNPVACASAMANNVLSARALRAAA